MTPFLCPLCFRVDHTDARRCPITVPTRAAAHELLDRARAGEDVPPGEIRAALRVTGDLTGAGEPRGVSA